jgi:hypothetical protein
VVFECNAFELRVDLAHGLVEVARRLRGCRLIEGAARAHQQTAAGIEAEIAQQAARIGDGLPLRQDVTAQRLRQGRGGDLERGHGHEAASQRIDQMIGVGTARQDDSRCDDAAARAVDSPIAAALA